MGVRLIEISLYVVIQDSLGLWIPESRSWIPDTLSVELESHIPMVNIRDLKGVVSRQSSSFPNYSPSIAMELKVHVSKEITCN